MLYSNYNLAFFLLLFENYLTIHSFDCRIDFSFSTIKYRKKKMARKKKKSFDVNFRFDGL